MATLKKSGNFWTNKCVQSILRDNFTDLFSTENGEPPPFASHPALTAALQNGPDGDGSVLSGAKALESCAYLAQSMLAHNFRDPSGLDPNYVRPGTGRFIPPGKEASQM